MALAILRYGWKQSALHSISFSVKALRVPSWIEGRLKMDHGIDISANLKGEEKFGVILLLNYLSVFGRDKGEKGLKGFFISSNEFINFYITEVEYCYGAEKITDIHSTNKRRFCDPDVYILDLRVRLFGDEFDYLKFFCITSGFFVRLKNMEIPFQISPSCKKGIREVLVKIFSRGYYHLFQVIKVHGENDAIADEYLLVRAGVIPSHAAAVIIFEKNCLTGPSSGASGHFSFGLLVKVKGEAVHFIDSKLHSCGCVFRRFTRVDLSRCMQRKKNQQREESEE